MPSSTEARARMVARLAGKPFDEAAWERSQRQQRASGKQDEQAVRMDRIIDRVLDRTFRSVYRHDDISAEGSASAARQRMVQRIRDRSVSCSA